MSQHKDLRRVFRARVEKLLQERGWSQSELARQAGLPRDQISTYLRETATRLPRSPTLMALARAFGVSTNELLPLPDVPDITAPPLEVIGSNETGFRVKINISLPAEALRELTAIIERVNAGDYDAPDTR